MEKIESNFETKLNPPNRNEKAGTMRSAFALLALAGLSQAKVFLFNAEKCNTNFDNEANWNNPDLTDSDVADTPMSASPPGIVEFANGAKQKPVAVRINQ
eukprot:gene25567-11228_t